MPASKKSNQLFTLTPIVIMLTSSVFMFVYSVFGMMEINSMMLDAAREQDYTTKIHSSIYSGLTKRSNALYKLINTSFNSPEKKHYLEIIKVEKQVLLDNQSLCIHNKVNPINKMFIQQAKMLEVYASIEKRILDLFKQKNKEAALSLYETDLIAQKEATLNQIMTGNQYIRVSSNKKFKNIRKKVFWGIIVYGLLNLIIIGSSLYFSIRIFKRYISNNKNLVNATKIDSLTNLSNRVHLIEEINDQIINHPNNSFAVAFIDIDYFKSINDIYGHALADNLLIEFGRKLSSQLAGIDHCLSRFGGDEFVLLLKNTDRHTIDKIMQDLTKVINANYYPKNGKEIWLSSSIGVSIYPDDATSIEMLLHNSDLAMYQAKRDGRSCYRLFCNKLKSTIQAENDISLRLQTSLSNKENITLVYQPLLNTQTHTVSDCEALLRWNDPKLGIISPDKFIAIAEKTNLIKTVNYYVIDEVCNQQVKWIKEGRQTIRVNINLAGNQEIFTSSLKRLIRNIEQYKLSPALFGVEITERSLFEINPKTVNQLKIINKMGIKLSIDDFGTGYSSLLYLSKLPITTLKIDKEFISNICNKEKDNAIILSIIKLGQSLGLDIVAEGVETLAQYKYLKMHSCNVIQGYLFSKPVSAYQLEYVDATLLKNYS